MRGRSNNDLLGIFEQKGGKHMKRTAIPLEVKIQVLTESGYRCAVPTCRNILALDLHHIVEVKDEGPNDASNLLALCPTCHALYTRGTISKEAIYAWKTMLVALSHAFDQESISNLLFLDKAWEKMSVSGTIREKVAKWALTNEKLISFNEEEIRSSNMLVISGDGLLKFSHLIASGLVDYMIAGVSNQTILYIPRLTSKGLRIIDAWISGDRRAVKEALGGLPQE
jgi:hypothetical protein